MADIAELGFKVDSVPLAKANNELEKLPPRAEKAERSTERFNREVTKTSGAVQKAAGGVSTLTSTVARLAAGLGAYLSIQGLIGYADAWSDMQSRVGAAIKDMDAAPAMMQRILEIANASYSPLAQTAEIYGRNVSVLKALGLGAAQAADYTESLNHMLVITATRGERAESVQNALSKAMALGKLTGEGLETVLANGGRVAEALAQELGTTVNGLRQMATDGKITSNVIAQALVKSLEDVRKEAGAMTATVADAFVIMNNNITAAIGQFDKANGVSATLAQGIIFLAENLDLVSMGVTGVATAMTVALLPAILRSTAAVVLFTGALLANPLTWYAALAGVAAAAFAQFIVTQNNAALAAQTHADALVTNANAIEVAKTSSQGFRDTLRAQIEMQLNAAKAALDEAGAQYQAARASAVRANAFGALMKTLSTSLFGEGRDTNYGAEIMNGALDNINTAITRVDDLKTQLGALDDVETNYEPVVHQVNAVTTATTGLTAANDNAVKSTNYLKEAQKELNEQYEFGKSTLGSFFSTFKQELMNGTSLWGAFGQAAVGVLDNIANKAMQMASNGIWDMIFGAIGGGMLPGGQWNIPTNFVPGGFFPGFASGGFTGNGSVGKAAGVVHGQEFVVNAAATQAVGINNLQAINDNHVLPSNDNGGSYAISFNPQYNMDGLGLTAEQVQEMLAKNNQDMIDKLPDAINTIRNDPRKRVVR